MFTVSLCIVLAFVSIVTQLVLVHLLINVHYLFFFTTIRTPNSFSYFTKHIFCTSILQIFRRRGLKYCYNVVHCNVHTLVYSQTQLYDSCNS